MDPEISFLVVCFNSARYIAKCIDSILHQTNTNYEIITIDNNSTDDTVFIIQDLCKKNKQIRLISNSLNLGFGNSLNEAMKFARGEFVAILNADVFLDKEWSNTLLKVFKTDPKLMSSSGTVYFPNGELQGICGIMDKYGAVIPRGSNLAKSRGVRNDIFFYNDGSSFMVRKKIFQELVFDPKLFLYYEDVDLCWKIRLLGYKIECIQDAVSYHDVGHSYSEINPSKFYHIAKNRIYLCQKNYSGKNLITRLPVTLFLTFLNAIFYDSENHSIVYTKTFFRAMIWNMINLKHTMKERKKLISKRKISDNMLDNYILQSSIELMIIRHKSKHATSF